MKVIRSEVTGDRGKVPVVFADQCGDALDKQAMMLSALGRESYDQAARDEAAAIRSR
jgi:hypothetical protein